MNRSWPAALAVAFLASGLAAQQTPNKTYVDSFERVWKTVHDKHWDPQFNGVDWQAAHDELHPRIERAENIGQVREILTEMIGRLHQSHFRIIPSTVYSQLGADSPALGGEGRTGIDVRILDGKAVVTSLDPDSGAVKAGVHIGWIITAIDSFELEPLLSGFLPETGDPALRDLTLRRAVLLRLEGAVGANSEVAFLNERDQPVTKKIKRQDPRGHRTSIGYLGPAYVWLDTRRIKTFGQTIEYISFNLFLDPSTLMPEFGNAVESCMECGGFILDLRGNPGGLGAMATGMAGWFVEQKDTELGTMILRDSELRFVINPRPLTYAGPLAILVDSSSASTSEILAGGLQDLKRARIFGSRTASAALPSVVERLPDGDAFQYAIADYVSHSGRELEGNGVIPDEDLPLTRDALLQHTDPALDAAVDWIRSQKTARTNK